MEKSFYYSVEWAEASYLKEALNAMEIPYAIEQDSYCFIPFQGGNALPTSCC